MMFCGRGCEHGDSVPTEIRLVKDCGTPEKGELYVPGKKRGIVRHGFLGSNTVRCDRNHAMSGKMRPEILGQVKYFFSTGRYCELCDELLDPSVSYYSCKTCDIYYCSNCSRRSLGLPVVGDHPAAPVELRAGDILMCFPGVMFGLSTNVHHVVLVTGPLKPAPWMVEILQPPPGTEIWYCTTVESTGIDTGKETFWIAAESYFARDPVARTSLLVADRQLDDDCLNICEKPVPVKVLMHPLRAEWGNPVLNERVFQKCVQECTEDSNAYGYSTFAKAGIQVVGYAEHYTLAKYPDPQSRKKLLDQLRMSWNCAPICPSVAIFVWQKYCCAMNPNEDRAMLDILKYMPLNGSRTAPSQLLKACVQCGWAALDNFEPM